MNKVQYLVHEGNYMDCEILEVRNGLYFILLDNNTELWVMKEELKFPKFGDSII